MTLSYDPASRLYQVAGGVTTRFAYDGVNAIAEYDGGNALQRRFVFGPDGPIVQYEGTGTTTITVITVTDYGDSLLNAPNPDAPLVISGG